LQSENQKFPPFRLPFLFTIPLSQPLAHNNIMYLPNKKRPWLPWLAGFLLIAFLVAFFHFLG